MRPSFSLGRTATVGDLDFVLIRSILARSETGTVHTSWLTELTETKLAELVLDKPSARTRGTDVAWLFPLVAMACLVPFAALQSPSMPGLNIILCVCLAVIQTLGAIFLLLRFESDRKLSTFLLAGGCLYSAALAATVLLIPPDAIGASIRLGGSNAAGWMFLSWLWGFSSAMLAAVMAARGSPRKLSRAAVQRLSFILPLAIAIAVTLIAWATTNFAQQWPAVMSGVARTPLDFVLVTTPTAGVGLSIFLVQKGHGQDELLRWLQAALSIFCAANILAIIAGGQTGFGWSAAQIFWLLAGLVLLGYFLVQFQRNEQQLSQERNNLEAVVAAGTAELRQSTALLRAISASTEDLLFAKDLNCRILFTNPAGLRAVGLPAEKVIGATGLEGLTPTEIDAYLANDRRIMHTGQSEIVEETMSGPTGTRTYMVTKAAMRDEDGETIGIVGISRDITDIKKVETELGRLANSLSLERERLALALLSTGVGIYEWRIRNNEVWWSPEVYPVYGVDPVSFTPTREALTELVHPADRDDLWRKTNESVVNNTMFEHEYRVLTPQGETRWVANRSRVMRDASGAADLLVGVATDITSRRNAEDALRESEARLRAFYESSPLFMGVTEPAEDDILHIHDNPASARFFRVASTDKKWILKDLNGSPEIVNIWLHNYQASRKAGAPVQFEHPYPAIGGGQRWMSVTVCPISSNPNDKMRFCYVAEDITDRKLAEEHNATLMREINHRAKNMLSVVQAISRQTAAKSPNDFVETFGNRIAALARAQDLLIEGEWRRVRLSDLITSQIDHFSHLIGSRIAFDGPSVSVIPSAVQSLGMAFHELGTNAAKYGALSTDTGRVTVIWRVHHSDERFMIEWRERDGPVVQPPARKGFGSIVIDRLVKTGIAKTEVEISYEPTGLVWRLQSSTEILGATPEDEAGVVLPSSGRAGSALPSGMRVLVLEDEPLLAMELAETLSEAGLTVVGPASSTEEAMRLLETMAPDAALLDINLGEETSERVASRLAHLGVPFLVASGYSHHQLPHVFRSAPTLAKPVRKEALVAAIEGLLQDALVTTGAE